MPRGRPLKRKLTSITPQAPAAPFIDKGTTELRNHHDVEENRKATIVITQTPIDWYYSRRYITQRQHEAASKLWELAEKAGVVNLKTQSYDPTSGCSKSNNASASDFYTSAPEHLRKKINKALRSLTAENRKIITEVVVYGHFVSRLETTPVTRNRLMQQLKKALDELADHWQGEKKNAVSQKRE